MTEILNPQDAELEEAVLGACLVESTAITLIADKMRPEMFYNEKYAEIYATILDMYRAGKQIDILTVKNELAARGKLEFAGGPYEVTRLSARVASSAHLEYHVLLLREMYIRRMLILGSHKQLAASADETVEVTDVLAGVHNLLDSIEGEFCLSGELRTMEQLMVTTVAQVEERVAAGVNGITGIPTGIDDLDRFTSGWQRGELIVIAARPAVGKTAFALHAARTAGAAGFHTLVFSLEMQAERLGDRWLLAAAPHVDAAHLRNGMLNPTELREVHEASQELSRLQIRVSDNPSMSMDTVRAVARMLQSKGLCDLVIFDYLQLCDMKSDRKNRNREQEVAQATRRAKLIAKEMNIPVILLSQLNRDSEDHPDCRPEISDLRESGAIEQDADVVILLYRPELYGFKTDHKSKFSAEGLGVAIVGKHRNGGTGDAYFEHDPSMTRLWSYVPTEEWIKRNSK
ncbi:replicative DNA helicase [Bacteroides sp.]|uniref:replicative DNA helicase n=1 Tax=Bacteroides sp. TaxID=29523 RepID=UPI003AB1EAAE